MYKDSEFVNEGYGQEAYGDRGKMNYIIQEADVLYG